MAVLILALDVGATMTSRLERSKACARCRARAGRSAVACPRCGAGSFVFFLPVA